MKQALLESMDRPCTKTVCWLDQIELMHENGWCRFKNDDEQWFIKKVYDIELDKTEIKRNWHVGGL